MADGPNGTTRGILRTALYLGLAASIVAMLYVSYRAQQERAAMRRGQDRLVANHGLVQTVRKRLAPDYRDANHDLIADTPTGPEALIDPESLIVAHYVGDDSEPDPVDWQGLQSAVAEATGKNVELREYLNSAGEVADIKNGTTHIVALHAADTPYVVNNAGFVPIAVLGTENGANGNHLAITVSAKSTLQSLADLRGRKLTCTRPDSITGYRAAIAVLSQQTGMRPDVNYHINFSHGQKRSILGLLNGDFEVAALSDDKLQSLLKSDDVKSSDYRVIYESQIVPRLTFGHTYSLRPNLAAKVRTAVLAFANAKGPADELTGQPLRFYPIDYKKDFEFVRQIDDCFDPRFHKWSKARNAADLITAPDSDEGS